MHILQTWCTVMDCWETGCMTSDGCKVCILFWSKLTANATTWGTSTRSYLPRLKIILELAICADWNGQTVVRWEESSDSTGPIFIPRRRGAARRRSRRRAGVPTTSSTRGTASWIQISDYRPTSDEDGLTSHNAPLWARPDATANPRR